MSRLRRLTWRDWAVPATLWLAGQVELWLVGPRTIPVHGPRWPFAVAISACALALCVRRTHPVVALVLVTAALSATATPDWHAVLLAELYLLVVAVFACGRYGTSPTRYAALVLPEVAVLLEAWALPQTDVSRAWAWGLNAWWIFALGAAFRREELLRNRVAEAVVADAQVRAAEQRLALAREVHDVVSHSLSVVVVQSEVARLLMATDPARAQEAMDRVQDTGRQALVETRRLVEALRDPLQADQAATAPTWPDIPALVRRMRDSGLPVTLEVPDREPALTSAASAAAYRVVQEALTNALRYAGKAATSVQVTEQADLLVIDVQNEGDPGSGPQGVDRVAGFGLSGMQERVAACGGLVTTGPRTEGGFRVRAVLPLGGRP